MSNKEQPLTKILSITLLFAILFTGAFSIAPIAFSTGYDDDDDDHDDCDDDGHSKHDDDDDCEPDPCDCKKPDEFTVTYDGPGTEDNTAVVEIYKKTDKIGEKDPIVDGITVWSGDNEIVLTASDFGKKKIGSNTGYRILWDDPTDSPDAGLVQIAVIDIHTSCSQELYIGQTFTDGEVTLTVQDGKRNGKTSIPISDPLTCEAPPEPPKKGFITLKKAVTSDNTSDDKSLDADDFQLFIKSVELGSTPIEITDLKQEVDAGTYTIHESSPEPVDDDPVYSFVLIAGDTACPAMLEIDDTVSPLDLSDEFTIQPTTNVPCTIYNDDEGDGSTGGTGETGVSFGHKGFTFSTDMADVVDVDTTAVDPDPEYRGPRSCEFGAMYTDSCMETIAVGDPAGQLITIHLVVDSKLQKPTSTLVLWSITSVMTNIAVTDSCILVGIFDSEATPHKGFGLYCGDAAPIDWNINYAFIETEFETAT